MLWKTVLLLFFFKWQVLLSPVNFKIGLSALPLIPARHLRDELQATRRSHTFSSGQLSDKALDVASLHVSGQFFPSCCSLELEVSKLLSISSRLLLLRPTMSFPKHPGATEMRKK